MINPWTTPLKYTIRVLPWSPMSRPDHLITVRWFSYIAAITIGLHHGGGTEGRYRHGRLRMDRPGGSQDHPRRQVEGSPQEDRADAAEAIEECLGNTFAKEGDTDRKAGDHDPRGAERCAQLDEALSEPDSDIHVCEK